MEAIDISILEIYSKISNAWVTLRKKFFVAKLEIIINRDMK